MNSGLRYEETMPGTIGATPPAGHFYGMIFTLLCFLLVLWIDALP